MKWSFSFSIQSFKTEKPRLEVIIRKKNKLAKEEMLYLFFFMLVNQFFKKKMVRKRWPEKEFIVSYSFKNGIHV